MASIGISALPVFSCSERIERKAFILNESLLLKGFNDEQEESPSLVTDGRGEMWMYTLRRLSYPESTEFISAFYYDGKKWKETNPVTKNAGQYEAPIAACASGGKPVVAWTEIEEGNWNINVAIAQSDGYGDPFKIATKVGNSINPVLIAPTKNRNWIAWENLHKGKFTIYISKYILVFH